MALHRYIKISVDLHLMLVPLHDRHSTCLAYVQKANGDLRGFLLIRWRKLPNLQG